MAAPPEVVAHKPHFHRNAPIAEPVRVATTTAGTLASSFENGDTVDGIVLATGDRILVKNQAAGAENGIYVVAASGTPSRAYDMDAASEFVGKIVYVVEGTANSGKLFRCTNTTAPTIGTTAITFSEFTTTETLPASIIDAKGDLIVGSAADAAARLAVGTDTHVLTADSAAANGVKWAAAPGAGALDDLTDANAPTPSDGDVLSWDDGASEWVPVAPPSGSVPSGTDPGDLLVWDGAAWDVLPIGSDDQVLTLDSGEALGVKWAAAGGAGSVPAVVSAAALTHAYLNFR